jgi:hypothetical protein
MNEAGSWGLSDTKSSTVRAGSTIGIVLLVSFDYVELR